MAKANAKQRKRKQFLEHSDMIIVLHLI